MSTLSALARTTQRLKVSVHESGDTISRAMIAMGSVNSCAAQAHALGQSKTIDNDVAAFVQHDHTLQLLDLGRMAQHRNQEKHPTHHDLDAAELQLQD